MFKKITRKIAILAVLFCAGVSAFAQSGTYIDYSPYSIFAFGDLIQQGSAYNRGMGNVGIATRNNRYINYLNPAAVTARDSLSFMADMSLKMEAKNFMQGSMHNRQNTFNINNLAISFPIYKSSAMMLGIVPFSSTGFTTASAEEDKDLIASLGNIGDYYLWQGNVYKMFATVGATFWDRLSVGVEGIYYFGGINKAYFKNFTNPEYLGIQRGYNIELNGASAKLGLQYEQPIGNLTLGLGATYQLGTNMKGYIEEFTLSTGSTSADTTFYSVDTLAKSNSVKFAGELGIGISLRSAQRWRAEFNYTRSDWSNTGIDKVTGMSIIGASTFQTTDSEAFKFGFEIVPNQNDIRYFLRRCAYRVGAYHNKTYYMMDGNRIAATGVTFGMTLPISNSYRSTSGISIAVDLGQRGNLINHNIRERYISFSVGLNLYDIWFQKTRYN